MADVADRTPDGKIVTARTDDQPLAPSLRARTPIIRSRPPPEPEPIDDPDTELKLRQARYLSRCRLDDDIRDAEIRRLAATSDRCRERGRSGTQPLRR